MHHIEEVFVKSFSFISRLLIFSIFTLFLLVACERPTPRVDNEVNAPEVPAVEATVVIDIPPTSIAVPTEAAPAVEATAVVDLEGESTGEGEAPVEGETPAGAEETAVPAQEPAPLPEDGIHTVQAGDTLFKLALLYGVTVDEIAAANGLTDVDTLDVGQEIKIPKPGTVVVEPTATSVPTTAEITHIVQPGENLFRIGLQYGFTVVELADYNSIANPDRIEVGQAIRIPPRP